MDRPHSRPKRIILRNILGGIFPDYWRSDRATHHQLRAGSLAAATRTIVANPSAAANPEGDNLENIAPAHVGGDVDVPHGAAAVIENPQVVGHLEPVSAHEDTGVSIDVFGGAARPPRDRDSANLNYLDAFAGRGRYEEDAVQTLEGDVSEFGSPIIAVQKALGALKYTYNGTKEDNRWQIDRIFQKHKYAISFNFNEANKENLEVSSVKMVILKIRFIIFLFNYHH